MKAASSSITLPSLNPRNSLPKVSNFHPLTNPTTRTSLIPSSLVSSTKPNYNALTKKFPSFSPFCSTKPDTSANSDTDNKPDEEPSSSDSHSANEPSSSSSSSPSSCSGAPPPSSVSRGLVFDVGPSNAWDSAEVGSPVVKRFLGDNEERWYMWYHGRPKGHPSSDMIGLAVSSNGIHWERGGGRAKSSSGVGFVMDIGKNWWLFDTYGIRPSEMVIQPSNFARVFSGVYWLYYTGYCSEKVDFSDHPSGFCLENPDRCLSNDGVCNESCGDNGRVFKSMPALAISQDGRHWTRIEGQHYNGALIDVGTEKEWDSLFISSPRVVFHGNGDLRMYYHSFDVEKGEFAIGIARSRDGIRWVKLGKIMGGGKSGSFDEFGAMNAFVVKNETDGNYLMMYEGVDADGRRSIGVAVSPDGLKAWVRLQDEAVLKPSEKGCWDDKDVGYPYLVHMDTDEANEWRLYYRGIGNGGRVGIGMAVSEGRDFPSFRRWTGFHV